MAHSFSSTNKESRLNAHTFWLTFEKDLFEQVIWVSPKRSIDDSERHCRNTVKKDSEIPTVKNPWIWISKVSETEIIAE